MERTNTHYEYEFEMDCTQHNGVYNKTKQEWLDKQINKQNSYNIKCDSKDKLGDKKVTEVKNKYNN